MADTTGLSAADVAAAAAAASTSAVQASQAGSSTAVTNVEDINAAEALQSGLVNETRLWNWDIKRNADEHASLDLRVQAEYADVGFARARANQRISEMLGHELVYALSEQRGYRARNDALITDRMVNIDEVAQLAAKTPVQLDVASSATLLQLLSSLKTTAGT